MKRFAIRNVTKREVPLFDKSFDMNEKGQIGFVDVSFGENGRDYMGIFSPARGVETSQCPEELSDFIQYLRFSPSCPALSSRKGMENYIALACNTPAFKPIEGSDDVCISGGDKYQFFVRLSPDDKVDAVIYCYDKQKLIDLGITEDVPDEETREAIAEVDEKLRAGNGESYNSVEELFEDMAQTNVSIRMDEDLKREFEAFCTDVGLTMTTAFCLYAKTVVREQRIPFIISREVPNMETRRVMTGIDERLKTGDSEPCDSLKQMLQNMDELII